MSLFLGVFYVFKAILTAGRQVNKYYLLIYYIYRCHLEKLVC